MRSKEEANDYRYFPDPDLLPLMLDEKMIESIRTDLPELPWDKRDRFAASYGLSDYDAGVLTTARGTADYFEAVAAGVEDAKLAANWVMGELAGALNKAGIEIEASPVGPDALQGLLSRIADETISGKIAKEVFESMWAGEGSADEIIDRKGLRQITDSSAIQSVIDQVLADNPQQLEQYRAGKVKLLGFFVGQVMKATRGQANPAQVNDLLHRSLDG
jgi:aspartyl-tRNA(Asn)/glutamyl-tRNA(Gln) amidotransferase subunit B